jgi:hypothetical protein
MNLLDPTVLGPVSTALSGLRAPATLGLLRLRQLVAVR